MVETEIRGLRQGADSPAEYRQESGVDTKHHTVHAAIYRRRVHKSSDRLGGKDRSIGSPQSLHKREKAHRDAQMRPKMRVSFYRRLWYSASPTGRHKGKRSNE